MSTSAKVRLCAALALVPATALLVPPPANAATATFANTGVITIPASGTATPYPSAITVAGLTGAISSVSVTLTGLTHGLPDEIGAVLVAPNGEALLVMDGLSNDPLVGSVNLTFTDSAAGDAPNAGTLVSGTYQPTAHYTGDTFPAPGPVGAYQHPGPAGGNNASFTSTFGGDVANGTWNLYVRDFEGSASGTINGGWSLTIVTTAATATPTLSSVAPASPSGATTPKVTGLAESGSTINLYSSPSCTGPSLGSGSASELAGAGITATVPANATTTIYAKASKSSQPDSLCSAGLAYTQKPPETSLTGTPKKTIKTTKQKVKVSFAFSSPTAGATFECSVDGKIYAACVSGAKFKVALGKHTFAVRALSLGATDSSPASFGFKVKQKNP